MYRPSRADVPAVGDTKDIICGDCVRVPFGLVINLRLLYTVK